MSDPTTPAASQEPVLAWLSEPATHPGAPAVVRIDTHSASIFLAGDRAYKLKRAVRYDYLDFSTLARRRQACEDELRLNGRLAPSIYLGVAAITRDESGRFGFDGPGPAVDWVVVMRRFPQDALLDRLAARGALDLSVMSRLAEAVARLHAEAAVRRDHGGAAGLRWVVEGNARAFTAEASGLDPAACADVTAAGLAEVERHAARLDRRKDEGRVRECHGDLHLRNAVLLDGSPTLFDGIEFNDELSCIDVAYDVAFLVMDLMHRRLPVHANVVFSHYLSLTGDLDALPLMPLFLSCRAAIRAKTSATAAGMEQDAEARAGLYRLAHAYLRMALDLLRPAPAVLVAVGGWSGSGKSTLVAHLAPEIGGAPGALVLRSDVLRKHLLGVPTEAHLGEEGYTPEVSRRVYERLVELAAEALGHGRAVIADAVWGRAEDRRRIAGAARAAGLRFVGLWLDAPRDTLASRLRARATDASDATVEVLDRQRQDTAPPDDWIRIDASGGADDTRRRAVQVLAQDD